MLKSLVSASNGPLKGLKPDSLQMSVPSGKYIHVQFRLSQICSFSELKLGDRTLIILELESTQISYSGRRAIIL